MLKHHKKCDHQKNAPKTRSNSPKHHFQCYLCKKQFTTKRSIREHFLKQHINPTIEKCSICDEELQSNESRLHSCVGLQLDCEYCTDSFKSLYELKKHLYGAHVEKLIYVCDICRRSFHMRAFMNYHKTKHTRGCFSCELCAEKFDTRTQRERHLRDIHPKISSKLLFVYICSVLAINSTLLK